MVSVSGSYSIKMSGRVQSKLEVPKKQVETEIVSQRKHWNDYSAHELRGYLLKNRKKADCSFVIENQVNMKSREVYQSFKWILCDMSPVLKQILDDPINQAKNWKEIVVSNPNNIKAVLFYGHFKVVDLKIIDLVDSYEASKQYQIPSLKDEVIKMCILEGIPEEANWVRLFWLTHIKYPEDQRSMSAVFKNVKGKVEGHDKVVDANIDLILKFDEVYFDIFFDIMLSRVSGVKCFGITEAYLIKHLFDGDKEKSFEDLGKIERDLVQFYVNKLRFQNLHFNVSAPLLSSKLYPKSNKIKILSEMLTIDYNDRYYRNAINKHLRELQAK